MALPRHEKGGRARGGAALTLIVIATALSYAALAVHALAPERVWDFLEGVYGAQTDFGDEGALAEAAGRVWRWTDERPTHPTQRRGT